MRHVPPTPQGRLAHSSSLETDRRHGNPLRPDYPDKIPAITKIDRPQSENLKPSDELFNALHISPVPQPA